MALRWPGIFEALRWPFKRVASGADANDVDWTSFQIFIEQGKKLGEALNGMDDATVKVEGDIMKRHQNHGLKKRCASPRRSLHGRPLA